MSLYQHLGDSDGQETTMRIIGGGEETPLSMVRPCEMKISSSGALDMNVSPYLTIGYLLMDEWKDLESSPMIGWLK